MKIDWVKVWSDFEHNVDTRFSWVKQREYLQKLIEDQIEDIKRPSFISPYQKSNIINVRLSKEKDR